MKTIILSIRNLMLIALLPLIAACGDDVTNNYYTQEPENPDPETPQPPAFEPGAWIEDIRSLCHYGLHTNEEYTLFPSWLLQAQGVRKAYADSEFAQTFITDELAVYLRNPGAGTRITLRLSENPVCHATEQTIIVPEAVTDEILSLQYPVRWNISALLNWKEAGMVNMEWTLLLDGQEVDRTLLTFNCRSLYQFSTALQCSYATEADEVEAVRQTDFGSYPVKEGDEYLMLYCTPFYMGYINDRSPLIGRLAKEVLQDGYLSFLYGRYSNNTKDLENCTSVAFNYLTLKYRIDFIAPGSGLLYVRPIDEVFSSRLGNHYDLALAFAAWCQSQGVDCFLEQHPAIPMVYVKNYLEGTTFPVSPGEIAMLMYQYPDPSELTKEELFEEADSWYEYITKAIQKEETEKHEPGRIDTPWKYCRISVGDLRPYLPSFGSGEQYADTRTTATDRQMDFIENPAWKR